MTVRKKKKVTKKATKKQPSKKVSDSTKKVSKEKRPVGRPTKYDPAFCETVIEYMAKGYSKEAVAGVLDIDKTTLYEWAKKYPEFSNAIAKGESKSRLFFEGKLLNHLTHTKNGEQLNGQVFNLNMKNRFGWSDKKEVNLGEETAKKFNFSLDKKPEELK